MGLEMRMAGNRAMVAVATALAVTPLGLAQPFVAERIIGTWEPVPGAEKFTWLLLAHPPQIDSSGGVLFSGAWLEGPGPADVRFGFFYGSPGQVSPVVVTHTEAPGAPWPAPYNQFLIGSVAGRALAESGFAALTFGIGNPGAAVGPAGGLYAGTPASLQAVAFFGPPSGPLAGPPAPGLPDQTTVGISDPLTNSSGQVAYVSALSPAQFPTASHALTVGTAAGLTLVAAEGQPVSAVPGATYTSVGVGGVSFSDGGHLAYYATLAGEGITSANDFAYLLRSPAGDIQVVAQEQSQAPTLPTGVTFAGFSFDPSVSATGAVEFISTLQGPSIDTSNNVVLWAGLPQDLRPFLQEGGTTRGMPVGLEVDSIDNSTINDGNLVLAKGFVRGEGVDLGNNRAFWLGPLDAPEMILREGSPASGPQIVTNVTPGSVLENGVVFAFGSGEFGIPSSHFALNDSGDILLLAGLVGPSIGPENSTSLWYREADSGMWSLVLRSGDLVDGRTIAPALDFEHTIRFEWDTDSGYSQGLNDDGTFAVRLMFTDGQEGLYRISVPEPSGGVLLVLAACALRRSRESNRVGRTNTEYNHDRVSSRRARGRVAMRGHRVRVPGTGSGPGMDRRRLPAR